MMLARSFLGVWVLALLVGSSAAQEVETKSGTSIPPKVAEIGEAEFGFRKATTTQNNSISKIVL